MKIGKAIIPAAGAGTRFLPYTKSIPKEMLPLLNKPAIEYIVKECIAANIDQLFFIINNEKEAIQNYFSENNQLSTFLNQHNKGDLIKDLNNLIDQIKCTYIQQPTPLGLGHAIWLARHAIEEEYVAVLLPDDIFVSEIAGIEQLIQVAYKENATIIAVQEVPTESISQYGIIEIQNEISPNLFQIKNVIEKPKIADAPSRLAIVGRYVFSHRIFQALETIAPDAGKELQLTDAIAYMLKNNEKVLAYKIKGDRYDIGNPLGWLKGVINIALQHPDYHTALKEFLHSIL